MPAMLRLTHKATGAEVRRGPYDIELDGKQVGSVKMNDTFETPIEPGRHTPQVRSGRNSSRPKTFDATDGDTIAFRATPSEAADAARPLKTGCGLCPGVIKT